MIIIIVTCTTRQLPYNKDLVASSTSCVVLIAQLTFRAFAAVLSYWTGTEENYRLN